MKIGIDIHGVLNKEPKFFKEVIQSLLYFNTKDKKYNEVHILTGITEKEAIQELKIHSIEYSHIFSITDYLLEEGKSTGEYNEYGRPLFPDEDWDRAKGDYCKRNNIDIMIDDTERYGEYFTTPFILWQKLK